MKKLVVLIIMTILTLCAVPLTTKAQQNDRARLDQIQESLKADVPRLLCLDKDFATGAQPTDQAYAKAAANGFRSVLSLRAGNEGVDLSRERAIVENNKMYYFNIPVVSSEPRVEQADQFIRIVKEPANHPMLINCASANRVGAFMMIYRVVEQGWSEDKALAEAAKIGLSTEGLKKFARAYIANHKVKRD
ncbi:MAG TPA: sulfur transferase domain-containing protein [Methylomirabilota bacterium]|nr:sulfur transferase domain-containing protein [Methylomirabilota bacterium]